MKQIHNPIITGTTEADISPIEKWSWKKRAGMAVLFSAIICASAVFLGSLIYWSGRWAGIINRFNLVEEVKKIAFNDTALVSAFYAALNQKDCTNTSLGYTYRYEAPLEVTPAQKTETCSELVRQLTATKKAYLKIQQHNQTASTQVNTIVSEMSQATTDTFTHPRYEGTIIQDQSKNSTLMIIVLAAGQGKSYSFWVISPKPLSETEMYQTIRSFRLI